MDREDRLTRSWKLQEYDIDLLKYIVANQGAYDIHIKDLAATLERTPKQIYHSLVVLKKAGLRKLGDVK